MEFWPSIEADFIREYRLDLAATLPELSWRKFLSLLSNLSSDASFLAALRKRKTEPVSEPLADFNSITQHFRNNRKR